MHFFENSFLANRTTLTKSGSLTTHSLWMMPVLLKKFPGISQPDTLAYTLEKMSELSIYLKLLIVHYSNQNRDSMF